LLSEAKIVFSASLQETLGIGCYEGALLNAVPLVPDRLSYQEMYYDDFKYPSEWTKDWSSYALHRHKLCYKIIHIMNSYESLLPQLQQQAEDLTKKFFSANGLIEKLVSYN
jgi:hypothetical protein